MSKLSRREFLRLGTLAAGGTLLAACGPAATPAPAEQPAEPTMEEEPTEAPEPEMEEVVTIRVGTFDWYSGNPDAPWDVFIQEVAFPKFKESRPNIEPVYEPMGGEWEDKILTQMAAGEAPDVISNWSPILETWNDKGQLLDLQPLIDRDLPDSENMFIEDAYAQMIDPFTGKRMGLVINQDITTLFYNKTAFEEAGLEVPNVDWTYDDYETGACAVLQQDADGNTTRWGGRLRGGLWWGWVYHIRAFGGEVRDEETWLECLLGEPEAQEALSWLQRMYWDDPNCFARTDQISATGLPNQSVGGLPGGIVCMAELSTEHIGSMQAAAQDFDWEWGETHYPTGPVARSAQGLPDVRSVYAGVVERGTMEAAWEWMKFICTEEWFQEEGITRTCARLPGLLSVVERWPTILREMKPGLDDVHIETIIEAIEMGYLSGSPNFRFHREAQELIDPALEAILVTGDQPPEYMKEVAAEVTRVQKELFAEANA